MKPLPTLALAVGLLAGGCTGPKVPTVTVHIRKAENVTVHQIGTSGFVVEPESARLFGHDVVQAGGGAVCGTLKPPGFKYRVSDVSDTGLSMRVTCMADGSKHQVQVIFVPEST